jgi:hypothetical protein
MGDFLGKLFIPPDSLPADGFGDFQVKPSFQVTDVALT